MFNVYPYPIFGRIDANMVLRFQPSPLTSAKVFLASSDTRAYRWCHQSTPAAAEFVPVIIAWMVLKVHIPGRRLTVFPS